MVVRARASEPPQDIPQRELRNDSSRVLREVADGRRFRVSVAGRPVADLTPVSRRDRDVPMRLVAEFVEEARARLDPDFWYDVRSFRSARRPDAWERSQQRDT